jgi:hypothetical protein
VEKTKATFMLSERATNALESLRSRLRKAGVARSDANLSAIIEQLIVTADFDELLRAFE